MKHLCLSSTRYLQYVLGNDEASRHQWHSFTHNLVRNKSVSEKLKARVEHLMIDSIKSVDMSDLHLAVTDSNRMDHVCRLSIDKVSSS